MTEQSYFLAFQIMEMMEHNNTRRQTVLERMITSSFEADDRTGSGQTEVTGAGLRSRGNGDGRGSEEVIGTADLKNRTDVSRI